MEKMYFAENLRKIREEKNMTQKDMAEFLGLKYNTYKQYESKRREPSIDTLIDITMKLNTTIDYLLKNVKRDDSKYIEHDKIINRLSQSIKDNIEIMEQEVKKAKNDINKLK